MIGMLSLTRLECYLSLTRDSIPIIAKACQKSATNLISKDHWWLCILVRALRKVMKKPAGKSAPLEDDDDQDGEDERADANPDSDAVEDVARAERRVQHSCCFQFFFKIISFK